MFVPTRGDNVYEQHNILNFLQKEVPMGSETCPKYSDEWCSLTFRAKKPCLRPNLRVLRASKRNRGVFSGFARPPRAVWVDVVPTRTLNEEVMIVLVNIGPFYGSPWKYFIFPWRFLPDRREISCPLKWRYCFHIYIYQPMSGIPFCSWLLREWVTACHPAKTRRIRHIAAGFSSIYGQMRLLGSSSICRKLCLSLPGG